jgi:hypothetical protein
VLFQSADAVLVVFQYVFQPLYVTAEFRPH